MTIERSIALHGYLKSIHIGSVYFSNHLEALKLVAETRGTLTVMGCSDDELLPIPYTPTRFGSISPMRLTCAPTARSFSSMRS